MPEISDREIVLSLISHTNVGKTALARTLLRRDVGEVADSAHVTLVPEAYALIESGDRRARLWDTPGFGSNLAKLAQRLRASDNPVGWILHQVWDRVTDRSLWCSQEAIRNVQSEADVVLYLVDASQSPAETGYIDLEIEVIEWIGKPVLVFLNQTGTPDPNRDARNEEAWRAHLSRHRIVKKVSTLDAFTRCWTQEHEIFVQAAGVLSGGKRDTARLLSEAWVSRQLDVFDDSVAMIADLAYSALADTEELGATSFVDKLKQLVRKADRDRDFERAQRAMYARLSERTKETVNRLIARHGLSGETANQLATASREAFAVKRNVEESLMAAVGGMGAGLLGGLCADLAAGGMTFGGGAILGMLAGGATTFALARGYNLTQTGTNKVRWTEAHFLDQVKSILLLYLAVAHFGRGRGDWLDPVHNPAHWQKLVEAKVTNESGSWKSLWKAGAKIDDPATLKKKLAKEFRRVLVGVLGELYPESRGIFGKS